jgi:hypothetical protein
MWLTGWPDEPMADRAGVLPVGAELAAPFPGVDVAAVLFGRAAVLGFTRRGRVSAGGSCRLLRAQDGWVAVSLAREDDVTAVPALVGGDDGGDPWTAVEVWVAGGTAGAAAARAALVGVSAAALGAVPDGPPVRTTVIEAPPRPRTDRPLVVDLSALWAGPLCAHLLGRVGARVVKVESPGRPDGARLGDRRFYNWLHAGHEAVALDFGCREFVTLLHRADVVIEASRPRALRQLGIAAEEVVAATGATWVSITGYGRDEAEPGRVAFGDDAAVAGGLVAWDHAGEPVFCGDAIADPLTGLQAANAALAVVDDGGGHLLDVAMGRVAAHAAAQAGITSGPVDAPVLAPRAPSDAGTAPELGADTAAVLAELA